RLATLGASGVAFTVMVNLTGSPSQPASVLGTTVISAISSALEVFVATKLILPDPYSRIPIAVLLDVHSKSVTPSANPSKSISTFSPAQTTKLSAPVNPKQPLKSISNEISPYTGTPTISQTGVLSLYSFINGVFMVYSVISPFPENLPPIEKMGLQVSPFSSRSLQSGR